MYKMASLAHQNSFNKKREFEYLYSNSRFLFFKIMALTLKLPNFILQNTTCCIYFLLDKD